MTQRFSSETITVIAGKGNNQKTFQVGSSLLRKSTVMQDWMEGLIPDSVRGPGDGAFHLTACHSEVVRILLMYLARDESPLSSYFDLDTLPGLSQLPNQDPIIYFALYKLANDLALEELATAALKKAKTCKCDPDTFITLALAVNSEEMMDDKLFRDSMMSFLLKNKEALKNSPLLKSRILEGGVKAVAVCSVLISLLCYVDTDYISAESNMSKTHPPPSMPVTPSSSKTSPAGSPPIERPGRPYTHTFQKSPSSPYRVHKSAAKHPNFNATVEDDN